MKYYMFRLSFPYGVHFGDGNLDSSNMTFHADTLFSALFIEAVKSGEQVAQQLLENTKKGNVVLSDAFPYIGDTYYLPVGIHTKKRGCWQFGIEEEGKKVKLCAGR